ncbi:MAG TPA: hypothetical protein VNM90_09860, partial [Haliangium sp.]|nr:hypothetical protein [Haliangium sp.]
GAHVTRALACDSGAESCCCCSGHEPGYDETAPLDHEQRIAPHCGCNIESAPQHLPPPLPGLATIESARTAPEAVVACVTLAWSPGPDRQRALEAHRAPRPPSPARSLLAQKTSLLV